MTKNYKSNKKNMDRHNDISQMDTRVFEISNGKNRHAVVLQFEIQATFGDGMGELRSKRFLFSTELT
jgi:hypothetical protein